MNVGQQLLSYSEAAHRALLMTDLVESTRHAREIGDAAMSKVWQGHDRIARELLQRLRGVEIEKTDGLVAVFDDADSASSYALAYHHELAAQGFPLKARVAIHAGPLKLRECDADHVGISTRRYDADGLVKPVTARLLGLATGQQTLLTADAMRHAHIPPGHWRSHGFWLFKGIVEPIEVFEVRDRQTSFSRIVDGDKAYRVIRLRDVWVPAREVAHSLPAERDSFVGRRRLLDILSGKVARGARLVSIIGVGGSGKTRVALRHAWTCLGDYPGGAWFCDLSQARSLDGVCFAVAQGLGIASNEADPVTQIARAIAGRGKCLVIADNFEQVAIHAEGTVGFWLDKAPEATILTTTREVLGIGGEETLQLLPMSADEGVQLFVERARSLREDYEAKDGELEAITQLVRGLDGLPLALELAAARVQVLSPQSMLARLSERFQWLRSRTGRSSRQATLRATFDWSWELLDGAERMALAQLSAFDGGFEIGAATAVVEIRQGDLDLQEVLESLVSKSFVQYTDGERFHLLESVREYAGGRLLEGLDRADSGGEASRGVFRRHWRFFGSLGEAMAASSSREGDNLVAACKRATSSGPPADAVLCLKTTWALLSVAGPLRIGVELAMVVLARLDLTAQERATAHWVAGSALLLSGDAGSGRQHLEEGLALIRCEDAPVVEARLLVALGERQATDGNWGVAEETLGAAVRRARSGDDVRLEGLAYITTGKMMDHQGRLADAREHYEKALAASRLARDRRLEGGVLGNLGGLHHDVGDLELARSLYEKSLQIAGETGDARWKGNAHCNLGLLCIDQGDLPAARQHLEAATAIARQMGNVTLEFTVLCNLGLVAEREGNLAEAVKRFQDATAMASRAMDRRAEGQYRGYLAVALAKQGRQDEARQCLYLAETLLTEAADQLSYALLMCQRGELELIDGRVLDASRTVVKARAIAMTLQAGPASELGRSVAKIEARLLSAKPPLSC